MLTRKLRRKRVRKYHGKYPSKISGLPLDVYASQLQFVRSLDRLLTSYTGAAIEVRRSSDNAVQEFNYVKDYIDTVSILAFVGANNGFISGYYDQVSGVKTTITVTAEQQQIVNAGAMVDYTDKYLLEIPQKTTLTIAGIACTNRAKNLNMRSYIGFKGSMNITGFNSDYVFPIKCGAGLMDFSIINTVELFWYDADGNINTVDHPAPVLVNAGVTYAFSQSFMGTTINVAGNNTGANWTGDVKDLPRFNYRLNIWGSSNLTGDVINLPRVTYYLDIGGCTSLTGNVLNLPRLTYYLSMWDCAAFTGNVNDLPRVTNTLDMGGCLLLTGSLANLPRVTYFCSMWSCALLTGTVADLPSVTYYLNIEGVVLITGNLSGLPAVSYYLKITYTYLLSGIYTPHPDASRLYFDETGMSANDTDQTIINLAAITSVAAGGILRVKNNRTAASDAAVAALAGKFAITYV